jgi:hypothetical protein
VSPKNPLGAIAMKSPRIAWQNAPKAAKRSSFFDTVIDLSNAEAFRFHHARWLLCLCAYWWSNLSESGTLWPLCIGV